MSFSQFRFDELPVVAILRGYSRELCVKAASAAVAGGLRNVEVTMNTDAAVECIAAMVDAVGDKANVGAGTVCSLLDLDIALSAGATFIVTPIVNVEVIKACNTSGVPIACGALTPTEVHQAWSSGADYVKVFPADMAGGPAYIKALLGPLNQVKLIPTGGVTIDSMKDYLAAGAVGFGVGSPCFKKDKILGEDWAWITSQCEKMKAAWDAAFGANE